MNNQKGIVPLIICVAIPLAVGGVSSLLTRNAMMEFADMNKPPLSPPGWLFPIVWTILYMLMGYACYRIYISDSRLRAYAIIVYGVQLVLNFCWSLIFFRFDMYLAALIWLVIMWAMIFVLMAITQTISKIAVVCLIPYLLWTTFAAYLNAGIVVLNK